MGRRRPRRSPAAALALLAQHRFDAIVSDIGMPAMDGPQLLAQVRDRHPNVVRLCLSDSPDDDAFLRAHAGHASVPEQALQRRERCAK